jgi:hypothetical protein
LHLSLVRLRGSEPESEPLQGEAAWLLEQARRRSAPLSRMFVVSADEVLHDGAVADELRRRPDAIVVATDAEPRPGSVAAVLAGADACICGRLTPGELGDALEVIDRFYGAVPTGRRRP